MLMAAVTSAVMKKSRASVAAIRSMPSIPSVPLISARPSFTSSVRKASPSPSRQRPTCASGARSPLAPNEPCVGTTGVTCSFRSDRSPSATAGRTPE